MAHDSAPKFDLTLEKGTTLMHSFNWYGNGKFMAPIEEIYCGYPTHVKVSNHGLPTSSPTPVFIEGLSGAIARMNTSKVGLMNAERLDDDWMEFAINTVGLQWDDQEDTDWKNNSGTITYLQPSDIDGWEFEMPFYKKWHDTTTLMVASTANGYLTTTLDDAGIHIIVPTSVTEDLEFSKAVWHLDAINGPTRVRCAYGTLTHVLGVPT